MEKQAGKRERMEESDESRRFYEEPETTPAKRPRKESNVDDVCEILSKMDNEDLALCFEEIEEQMVWDMMKMLEEEIVSPSPSCTDSNDTGTSSNGSDELESSGDTDCSINGELDYLLCASDDELGIPCSPSVSDYDYNCLEIEEAEQQLLLQILLDCSESAEQEGSGHFCVHNLYMVSNQIQSR